MRTRTRLALVLAGFLGLLALSTPADAIVQTQRITVATTATLIWTAPAGSGRILVRNPSTVSVYVGGSAVTTATGFEIAAGDSLGIMLANRGTIYGVVAAATQVVYTIQGDNLQ